MENKGILNLVAAIALFVIIGITASAITVAKVWVLDKPGQTFTLFDMIGPLPAAFLGPVVGMAAILAAKVAAIFVLNSPLDAVTLMRLLPPLFAAYFFATYKAKEDKNARYIQVAVPLMCIALFLATPTGQQVWFFPLMYWLIPPIIVLALPNHLFLRSLGATFTQHAIGGVLFLYFVPGWQSAGAWMSVLFLVPIERLVFAGGMSACFVLLQTALAEFNSVLVSRHVQPWPFLNLAKKKPE